MNVKTKYEIILHYIMSFVGGIFALYALLEHANVFGSAETSNMIMLVKDLLSWDLMHILIRLGSMLVYGIGICVTLWMSKYKPELQKRVCIIIDCIAALILGLLSPNIDPIISLYPVAFAMSIQWCSFRGVSGNTSATTFSTNNFRQVVTALFNYFSDGETEQLFRLKFYLSTILSFHTGVAVIYLVWYRTPHYSIWIALLPLAAAFIIDLISESYIVRECDSKCV